MEPAPDSTEVDPEGHRIVLETDHVRVLEVRLPAGRQVPMHSHPPRVIVAISSFRLKSIDSQGRVTVVDRRAGEALWSDGQEHAAEMMTDVHVIEVEVKTAR
jgi:hypothetical protein